jgi:hypothetical protein
MLSKSSLLAVSVLVGMLSAPGVMASVEPGDPARWYREDVTPRQHFETARKEAGAAYKEAIMDCAKLYGAERAACMKEARQTYKQDLADAQRLLVRSLAR